MCSRPSTAAIRGRISRVAGRATWLEGAIIWYPADQCFIVDNSPTKGAGAGGAVQLHGVPGKEYLIVVIKLTLVRQAAHLLGCD